MKKNLRIVSVAAAALLAVAPVVSTAIPVNADTAVNVGSSTGTGANTTNTNTQAPQNKPYFTYNNEIIGESTQSNPLGNVVRTTVSFKSGDKVSDLKPFNSTKITMLVAKMLLLMNKTSLIN